MKDTKRRFPPQTFYDRTGIQRELEAQAEKGWYLEKCSALGWVYRRGTPKKVHYAVTYFPNADAYDPAPSEEQLRFQEFCAHTGWELVSSNVQLQIFRNSRENPIPIETDPMIEVENIHAAMKKGPRKTWISQLALALMNLGLQTWNFSMHPTEYLATNFYLILDLLWLLLLTQTAAQLIVYRCWLGKARKNAAEGLFTETRGTTALQYIPLAFSGLLLMLLPGSMPGNLQYSGGWIILGTEAAIAVSVLFTQWMKKNGVDGATNKAVSAVIAAALGVFLMTLIVAWTFTAKPEAKGQRYTVNGYTTYIYHEDIPLEIEDLMESNYENYSYEILDDISSPLLRYRWCRQSAMVDAPDEPEMDYKIMDVKIPVLWDWVVKQMLEESFHPSAARGRVCQALDAAPWGAVEVYRLVVDGQPWDHYLVCYESRIVYLDLSWTPTEAQMAAIGTILGK